MPEWAAAFTAWMAAIAGELFSGVFKNYMFAIFYILMLLIIRKQYPKYIGITTVKQPEDMNRAAKEAMWSAALTGVAAGFVSSLVITAAGIAISREAMAALVITMLLLYFFNSRLINISYAAGILAFAALLTGFPGLDPRGLLGLAAIINMAEGVLVFTDCGKSAKPVLIKHKGGITGAFLTRKIWPVPFVLIMVVTQQTVKGLLMPDLFSGSWLPLLPSYARDAAYALGFDCMAAAISYTDLSIATKPREKSRRMAVLIFCHGAALMIAVVAAAGREWLCYSAVIFCIAGYECIMRYGKYIEYGKTLLYAADSRGIKVLDVKPGSHAGRMGLECGDTILAINGHDVLSVESVGEILKDFPAYIWMTILKSGGMEKNIEYRHYPDGVNVLGISIVPREREISYDTVELDKICFIKDVSTNLRSMDGNL